MSNPSGYGNGYGYSGPSRYDANDGGYGGNNTLGVNGYNGRGAPGGGGRSERRPGGYGGFYPDAPQPPALTPGQTPSPGQSPERQRDRSNRDRQQASQPSSHASPLPSAHPSSQPSAHSSPHPPSQSSSHPSSRSRTRNQEPERKYQGERSRDRSRYTDERDQRNQGNASPVIQRSNDSGEAQAIESLCFSSVFCAPIADLNIFNSDSTVDPARLGFHDRCRVYPGTRCFESNGYKYIRQSRSRTRFLANVRRYSEDTESDCEW